LSPLRAGATLTWPQKREKARNSEAAQLRSACAVADQDKSALLDHTLLLRDDHNRRRNAAMPSGHNERYDFFLSRRGSVAAIAREVADVLREKGYKVLVQDYDIPISASFIDAMHTGVKNSRDLIILFTHDYEQSPYTRKEFTSFEAERAQSGEERHIIVL